MLKEIISSRRQQILYLSEVPILKGDAIDGEITASFSNLPLICVTFSAFWLRERTIVYDRVDKVSQFLSIALQRLEIINGVFTCSRVRH